jgi:hypothetical protein
MGSIVRSFLREGNFHVSRILETSKYKLAPEIGNDPTQNVSSWFRRHVLLARI